MDVSTDSESDTSEDILAYSATHDVHIRGVPAFVTWQSSGGEKQCLENLDIVLTYRDDSKQALIRLQTGLKPKKESARPNIYLVIKPDQIQAVSCSKNEDDQGVSETEKQQHWDARMKLNSSIHSLRFVLRSPAVLVVPKQYLFSSFRAGSQATWKSWETFARDTLQFMVHFPTKSVSKARLLSCCQALSRPGNITSIDADITSLYGGRGGRIVDAQYECNDGGTAVETEAGTFVPSVEDDAPPAYNERAVAGPSMSSPVPPLCLSPQPHFPKDRKRRRAISSPDPDRETIIVRSKRTDPNDTILQSIASLRHIVERSNMEHMMILNKMLAKMEEMDDRISQIEKQQHDVSKEIETCVEPLWDELSARLQSQEDREHDYMRDIVDEVFEEKIDERIPEAVDHYFRSGDDGQALVSEVVGERIQEETKDFLRRQRFTGHLTISEDE